MSETPEAFQAGTTVRLQCIFEDFDGVKINPTIVRITFYDTKYNKLQEYNLNTGNSISTGIYIYNFITSSEEERRYVYEWYGEIDGLPSLKRSSFRTIFI